MPQPKEKMRERYWSRKNSGLCFRCGIPTYTDKVYCHACGLKVSDKAQKLRQKNRDARVCSRCRGILDTNNTYCKICTVKKSAYDHLGSASRYKELFTILEKQQYLCPYTGEQLIIGENASVEHILPRSRFPGVAQDITNLEWVSITVNEMKGALTRDEFLAMVRLIYEHTGKGG